MEKFKLDSKIALSLAGGILAVGTALVTNKQKANEKLELEKRITQKVLETLSKKEG